MRNLLKLSLIMYAICAVDSAAARPLILTERDAKTSVTTNMLIMEDPEGKLGISDVTSPAIDSRFKLNRQEDLNLGLTQSAYWMKFEVTNRNESQNNFVLVCEYRLIDHFDVYLKENEQWRVFPGGDQHPRDTWSERQRTPFVSIDLPSGSSRTIFIRARSEGSVQLPVYIFTPEAFAAENRLQNIWGGLVLGVFVFVILYSLLYGVASRSVTQIAYSIFLTGLGLFVITQSGIGQMLLWGPANVITNPILVLAGGVALIGTCLFFVRYLSMGITQPRLKYAMYGSFILGVLLILTAVFLPYHIGAILLIPCAIYDASVVFLANIIGTVKKQRQAITGLIAWSVACAGFIVVALQYAGLLPRNFFIENANILGVLFGITLQSLAIADRVLFLQRQQIETAEKHNLELEQKIEERTREVRQSRNEVELLAEFARRINETTDVEIVLDEILEYFETEHGLESVVVSIVDTEFNELRTLRARYLTAGDDPRTEFVRELRIPLIPESGTLYRTFRRQRPFYMARRLDPIPNEMDLKIVNTLGLKAYGHIPLVIQNRTIGIVWTNFGTVLPGREVRQSLERFCQQIAGALHSAILLERFAVARNEIEQLAAIARRVTEDTDTDAVLNSIFAFLEDTYGVDAMLFLADAERRFLRVAKFSEFGNEAEFNFLQNLKLPLVHAGGIVARVFLNNRMDVYNSPDDFDNAFDELIATTLRVRNYAHIPLRVKGEVIGVLSVTGRDRSMLFSEQLAGKIERFCTQIAGAVQAAGLLDRIREEQERTEQGRQQAEVLASLSRQAIETRDLVDILAAVAGVCRDALGTHTIAFYLPNEANDYLQVHFVNRHGSVRAHDDYPGLIVSIPVGREGGSLARTFQRKRPLYLSLERAGEIASAVDRTIVESFGFDWFAQQPLLLGDEVVGILVIGGDGPLRLSPEQRVFLTRVADQVAGAVRNAALLDQLRAAQKRTERANQEIESLNDLIATISKLDDLEAIMEAVREFCLAEYNISTAGGYLYDENKEFLVPYYIPDVPGNAALTPEKLERFRNLPIPLADEDKGTFRRVHLRQKQTYIRHIRRDKAADEELEILDTYGIREIFFIPMMLKGAVIGFQTYVLRHVDTGVIDRAHRNKLSIITEQISGIIHSRKLFDETIAAREAADLAARELAELNEFSRVLNASLDLDEIFDRIFDYLTQGTDIDTFWLQLIDRSRQELYTYWGKHPNGDWGLRREERLSAEELARRGPGFAFFYGLRVPLDRRGGTLAETYRRQAPLFVPDVAAQRKRRITNALDGEEYPISALDYHIITKGELRSLLQVPLVLEDEVIGILNLTRYRNEFHLSPAMIDRILAASAQVTGALHNAILIGRVDEERGRAEQAAQESYIMAQLAREANQTQDLGVLMETFTRTLRDRFPGTQTGLWVVDEARNALVVRGGYVESNEIVVDVPDLLRFVPLDASGGSLFQTFRRGKTSYLRRVRETLIQDSPVDLGVRQHWAIDWVIQLPLFVSDRVVGILSVGGKRETRIPRKESPFLERLAAQIAGAVQAAALLEITERARAESDRLLISILPRETADELKEHGRVKPQAYKSVSVLFSDFAGFTHFSESLSADRLVQELDGCFSQFDEIVRYHQLEKLKTIGDAYMCAGGLPRPSLTHAVNVCLAALEMLAFIMQTTALKVSQGESFWQIRIGIHSGPVTAGVIGNTKFAYDIWGDTVNTASRMESGGVADRINISGETFSLVKEFFECEYRGKIDAKGKGALDMYFLNGIRPELASDSAGLRPNAEFEKLRAALG